MSKPPFLTRVKLRNYKSIARCDVELGPLAILVGPNAAGKSNFLDALAFTHDALCGPLHKALWERGGITEVMRRSAVQPDNFSIDLHFLLNDGTQRGRYCFEIAAPDNGSATVRRETCAVAPVAGAGSPVHFTAQHGKITDTNLPAKLPRLSAGRLFLINASNLDAFRPVYDALTGMNFYKFDLDAMRRPQPPDCDNILRISNGHNLAGVLGQMERTDPQRFSWIQQYMRNVVPEIKSVNRIQIPTVNLETIRFAQQAVGPDTPLEFTAVNMSDGALRALAVLTALLQGGDTPPSLVGIEEPETALHPAAAGGLWDALNDGADRTQVLVTTHSPDLLHRKEVPPDAIVTVDMVAGKTEIAPISESSQQILRKRLATPGELLRQDRLSPTDRAFYPQCFLPNTGCSQ